MRSFSPYNFIFLGALLIFSFAGVAAQAPNSLPPPPGDDPPQSRPNLLQELNLSNEQIQQIRRLNRERRPAMIEAQRRFREANRALDAAIYKDAENETEIEASLKAANRAHEELLRNRIITERAIRKILTGEQLAKFRDLRRRFSPENDAGVNGFVNNRRRQRRQEKLRSLPRGIRRNGVLNNQKPPRQPR